LFKFTFHLWESFVYLYSSVLLCNNYVTIACCWYVLVNYYVGSIEHNVKSNIVLDFFCSRFARFFFNSEKYFFTKILVYYIYANINYIFIFLIIYITSDFYCRVVVISCSIEITTAITITWKETNICVSENKKPILSFITIPVSFLPLSLV